MSTLAEQLRAAGVQLTRGPIDDVPVELTWTANPADPIVDSRVIVMIPDLHLGDGGAMDIFRGAAAPGTSANRDRFDAFLSALVTVRQRLAAAGRAMNVVQLGDCYDLWRTYPFYAHVPGQTYAAIDTAYKRTISLLIDGLDARFCVGNHDADLGRFPPDWAFAGSRLAYSQRACQGRVFAFHGHQTDDFAEAMAAQNGETWVALGSVLAALVNPVGQALQEAIDRREDTYPGDAGGYPEGAAAPGGRFTSPRWSDRGGRKATLEKIFAGMAQVAPAMARAVRIVFVGHTHRPGVAWFEHGGRVIPVVDVGSWTYGRSQFAIIEEGSVQLWRLA